MASNKNTNKQDDDFEKQSRRHFALQFGHNSTNEEDEFDDNESNELLRDMQIPQHNYWDFSLPRPNRYFNLPAQIDQSRTRSSENPSENDFSENESSENYMENDLPLISETENETSENTNNTRSNTARNRFRQVSDNDLNQFLKEQENKNTARKTKSDMKLFQMCMTRIDQLKA